MKKAVPSISIATLTILAMRPLAVSQTAQAAPIAPLGTTVTANLSDVTQVRRCWHCHRCGLDRWGRVRCW